MPTTQTDDLAQEVLLRLLRYSDGIVVINPLGSLVRIARNVVNEWRASGRVKHPHNDRWLDTLLVEPDAEPEHALVQSRADEFVQAAVDRLPIRQRELLILYVKEGLTYQQIAQLRGLTHRIVLRDLTHAYSTLRGTLRLDNV